jgi:hypothetical protein
MVDSLPSGCSFLGAEDSRSCIFNVSSTCHILDDFCNSSLGMLFAGGISRDGDALGFKPDPGRLSDQPVRIDPPEQEAPNPSSGCSIDSAFLETLHNTDRSKSCLSATPPTISKHFQKPPYSPAVAAKPASAACPSSAAVCPPAAAGGMFGAKLPKESPDANGRAQGTWTAAENVLFFDALRAHGRAFDRIHDAVQGGKSREQVLAAQGPNCGIRAAGTVLQSGIRGAGTVLISSTRERIEGRELCGREKKAEWRTDRGGRRDTKERRRD